ncbi:MAG TPA: hypothetical protein VEB66_00240 [Opitutaceae bacterium]|nr:hypothetical protein [Opitutaceae bacterium]
MTTAEPALEEIVVVPTDRFFVLETEIDPGAPAAGQVELMLEDASPFPLAQVFHGFVVAPDGTRAIAFAAIRKRFAPEELAEWPAAVAVVPSFVALLARAPTEPLVVVHAHEGAVVGVGWDGRAALPVAVAARSALVGEESAVEEAVAELRARLGQPEAEVRRLAGPIGVGRDDNQEAVFRVDGQETARLAGAALADADVRDKSFLEERRRLEARERVWGRLLAVAGLLLLTAGGLELGTWALRAWNARSRAGLEASAAEVARIEAAATMASRVEELAARRERPLEWLAQVAAAKPRSVYFVAMTSRGGRVLEIEAQTPNPSEVGAFETTLRSLAGVASVEVRDLRSREGRATFLIAVRFAGQDGGAR